MSSNLPIDPFTKALKWLAYLIGATLILLLCSIASFRYIKREASEAQVEQLKVMKADRLKRLREKGDILARNSLRTAITVEALISASEKYNNQYVWVKGYLDVEFEGDALYRRECDYKATEYRCGLGVQFTDLLLEIKPVTDYSKRYVVIRGLFRTGQDIFPGVITQVDNLNTI